MGYLTVAASGQHLTVDVKTPAGHEELVYTDATLGTPITLPLAITADKDFYLTAGTHLIAVTVTTAAGVAILSQTVEVGQTDHVVLTPLPTPAQEAATDSAAPSGGSLTVLPIPTTLAEWDVANASGTWVDNGDGTVSQTDAATIGDYSVFTLADVFAKRWVLQTRVRFDTEVTGSGGEVGIFVEYPATAASGVAGTGFYLPLATGTLAGTLTMQRWGLGNNLPPTVTVGLDTWRSLKFVQVDSGAAVYFDGVLLGFQPQLVSNTASSPPSPTTGSRVALYASGGVTFNLTATTVSYEPLP